jgi:hypothetical protein
MNDLERRTTPPVSPKSMWIMSALFVVLFGGWMLLQEFTKDVRIRSIELPYRTMADITEDHGPWSGEGTHEFVLRRGDAKSASHRFMSDEWPLVCRFYADAIRPDSLMLVQFNPAFLTDIPGNWLNAQTLEPIALELLPDSLQILDQKLVE